MRDDGDWFWYSLLIGTAGCVGLLHALPDAKGNGIIDWVAALGGWAAALVAAPSLIILLRQTSAAELQANLARASMLEKRAGLLVQEHGLIMEIADQIGGVLVRDFPPSMSSLDETAEFAKKHIDTVRNTLRRTKGRIAGLATITPSIELEANRRAVVAGLDRGIAQFADLRRRLVRLGVEFEGGRLPHDLAADHLNALLDRIDALDEVFELLPEMHQWAQYVERRLRDYAAEVDKLTIGGRFGGK